MDQSTLVSTGAGEQNLTPGEQRILSLMEQGQRRMEQRMQSMEVEHEAGASKTRDRQLAADLERLREEGQEREARFRKVVSERFDQHNTRLEVLEQTIQLNCEAIRENSTALQGLRQEVHKLAVVLEQPSTS
jgi:hypothetical protein